MYQDPIAGGSSTQWVWVNWSTVPLGSSGCGSTAEQGKCHPRGLSAQLEFHLPGDHRTGWGKRRAETAEEWECPGPAKETHSQATLAEGSRRKGRKPWGNLQPKLDTEQC